MLKFIFWALVAANGVLFAYREGYLGQAGADQHEPARLQNQLAPERMALLTSAEAKAAADDTPAPAAEVQAAPAPVPTPAEKPLEQSAGTSPPAQAPVAPPAPAPQLVACVQTGALAAGDARRFETRIARLDLGGRQSRIEVPFQEVTNYLVHLPPNGGREGAQRRAAELKENGVESFFIMQEDSPLRWAVSLGVFKTEARAERFVSELQRQGVRGVRVLPRGPQGTRAAWQFRRIDVETRGRIAAIADDFTGGELRRCQ